MSLEKLEPRVQKKVKVDEYEAIRLGGIRAQSHNWWDEPEEGDPQQESEEQDSGQEDDQEWKYLEHHGVVFPAYYKVHGVPLIYEGAKKTLTPEQEELCTYWAQSMGSPWEEKETYRKNFESLMQSKFPDFELAQADFSLIKQHLEQQRVLRQNRPEEVKKQEKADKEARDTYYGQALVDGRLERVGNYTLELPTLFKGLLKARKMPEDLTVNVSEQAPVPKCGLPGHSWGSIVHRNDVTWLVSYLDSSIKKDNHKYVQFAATSRFKQMNDKRKYEKARRLKNSIDKIREDYNKKLQSSSVKDRQLGTATYLIDKLALRVGNEKDEDEADTVGCCSLRVEHVFLKENHTVLLKFLGKDSMEYKNEVKLEPIVWRNLSNFSQGKKPESNLFNEISADDLNEYLKTQMEGLTAKVFRTYNASYTLQQQLDQIQKHVEEGELQAKVDFYDNANKQVAILCNHQKTVPKSFEVTKQKILAKINCIQQYIDELRQHAKSKDPREHEVEVQLYEDAQKKKSSVFVKKFPVGQEKIQQIIQKQISKLEKEKRLLDKKEENKEIALGTSKTNYNDPRISVAWCKLHEVPIERVFAKNLRSKFIWAMSTDSNWKF